MLMAILYCDADRIAAAAMACDQMEHGDQYWLEIFPGEIETGSIFETAYINVNNEKLCYKLLNLGMDDQYDGSVLAAELEASIAPKYQRANAA